MSQAVVCPLMPLSLPHEPDFTDAHQSQKAIHGSPLQTAESKRKKRIRKRISGTGGSRKESLHLFIKLTVDPYEPRSPADTVHPVGNTAS